MSRLRAQGLTQARLKSTAALTLTHHQTTKKSDAPLPPHLHPNPPPQNITTIISQKADTTYLEARMLKLALPGTSPPEVLLMTPAPRPYN